MNISKALKDNWSVFLFCFFLLLYFTITNAHALKVAFVSVIVNVYDSSTPNTSLDEIHIRENYVTPFDPPLCYDLITK